MIYADETFYEEGYLLGRKPVICSGFSYYARQASQLIDLYTFGRVPKLAEIPDCVRMCCCELAEAGFRTEKRQDDSGGKTSEKIGTYSVSYGSTQELTAADVRLQKEIIVKWLGETGLCYQGV